MLRSLAWRIALGLRRRRADRAAHRRRAVPDLPAPPAFIVGCGRSGTTILGRILSLHQGIHYVGDPFHRWAAIDARLDLTNLHRRATPRLFWEKPATEEETACFRALFHPDVIRSGRRVLVEKTPHNVFRIGWLLSIAPDARFIHVVRDGVEVARSIERITESSQPGIFGRSDYDRWWGSHGAKWKALQREGPEHGYPPGDGLTGPVERGAYEWLTSAGEAARWRDRAGDAWLDVRHAELSASPREVLRAIARHLGLEPVPGWIERGAELVEPRTGGEMTLELPATIAEAFNARQASLRFEGRARVEKPGRSSGGDAMACG